MTPDKIALIQESFAQVAPIAPQAADIFYGRLFEVAPGVRGLFPEDMTEQKRKLMTMLGTVVHGLDRVEAILPAVQELGRRHRHYGVEEAHYAVVGETLLYTLKQGLGDEFTDDVRGAWAEAYGVLAAAMVDAAERPAA